MSAVASICFVTLLAPWPDFVSMRMSTGLSGRGRLLQRGGVLERVGGHDTVVVVGGGDERGRVRRAGLDVVERRVGVERLELLRVVARAVVGNPVPADRELVEAEHVHDADLRDGDAEEVGALVDDRADQQAAVRPALGGEPGRRGVLVGDQPLGRGDEVVEDVLLLAASCPRRARPRRTRCRRAC